MIVHNFDENAFGRPPVEKKKKNTNPEIEEREPVKLEKGDLLAIILAAGKVFLPIFVGLWLIVLLTWLWLF